ncbi:MAG: DUF4149 domain-containing protein [Firmicutes bacterium]|nr:DUF4149 domain-containing protein [Bacillota bacterium]
MFATLRVIYHTATGVALGTMIFFTAIVAEQIFATLPLGKAGDVLAAIFPPYYTLVTLLCGLAFIVTLALLRKKRSGWLRSGQWAVLIATVFMAVGWLVFLPIMNNIRATIPTFSGPQTPAIERFFMYHGLSMGLNLLAILLLFWAEIIFIVKHDALT